MPLPSHPQNAQTSAACSNTYTLIIFEANSKFKLSTCMTLNFGHNN